MKTLRFDFNKPADARRFLSSLWIDEQHITRFKTDVEGWIEISDMSDEQCMRYATDFWENLMQGDSRIKYREPRLS